MYYACYFKHNGKTFDIKTEPYSDIDCRSIGITNKQKDEILQALNKGLFVHIIEENIVLKINEAKKRLQIETERDGFLEETEPYFRSRYADRVLGLTDEEKALLLTYYDQLLNMPEDFDNSLNKDEWYYVFVTPGDDETIYELEEVYILNKPIFIV